MNRIGPPLPPAPPILPAYVGRSSHSANASEASVSRSDATGDFAKLLFNQVGEVNSMQRQADGMVHSMLTGGDVNQAEVLTAVQKADLAFRMMLQVRNKLVDAFRELQQIQI